MEAAPVGVRGAPPAARAARRTRWGAAALAMWIALAALQWAAGAPLGHDEAQYAMAAQDRLTGEPVRFTYLSVGMEAISIPGALAGGGARALRALPLLLGALFALAAAAVAHRAAGAAAAAWTLALLPGAVPLVRRAPELLSDLPAATCLLAATAIAVHELTRTGGPRWRLLLAAPCLAAAIYLRYGSLLAIAGLGLGAIVGGWRGVAQRPAVVAAAVLALGALTAPFLALSQQLTGSPLGILRDSSTVLGEAPPGASLLHYATANPLLYYGVTVGPALLAGLVAIRRARDARVRILWVTAVVSIVAIGLTPVAQVRYIFFGVTLLAVLGVAEVHTWIAAARPRARRVATAVAVGGVVAAWGISAVAAPVLVSQRLARMEATLAAIAAIRGDAPPGAPCRVIGRRTTQLQWYTGCLAVYRVEPELLARERVYVVIEPGSPGQPALVEQPGALQLVHQRPGVVATYRLLPTAP